MHDDVEAKHEDDCVTVDDVRGNVEDIKHEDDCEIGEDGCVMNEGDGAIDGDPDNSFTVLIVP